MIKLSCFQKKLISLFLILFFIVPCTSAQLPGDLNQNGWHDSDDLNRLGELISRYKLNRPIDPIQKQQADLSPQSQPDGILDENDFDTLVEMLYDGIRNYSLPTPTPVVFPTHTPSPQPTPTPISAEATPTPTQTIPIPTFTASPSPVELAPTVIVPIPNLPENAKPLELVLIPAGIFKMGSPDDELERNEDEGPQHTVQISNDFYMGKFLITQAQWESIMGNNPSFNQSDGDLAVESVTWFDALQFIQNLNMMNIGTFRLPTEAEWEFACRAGTTTRYYWGDDLNYTQYRQYVWNWHNSDQHIHPVGLKLPNAWGLYDMNGNAQEWVQDWYAPYSAEPQIDPTGPLSGTERVIRGGFWGGGHEGTRSAARESEGPGFRSVGLSFRVIMEIPRQPEVQTPDLTPEEDHRAIQFGVNLQLSNFTSQNMKKLREDNFSIIRYYAHDPVMSNLVMIQQAIDNNVKVILTFATAMAAGVGIDCSIPPCIEGLVADNCNDACWWNLDLLYVDPEAGTFERRYTCDPEGYAHWVKFRLEEIEKLYPYAIGNTLVGIQLGNEEEADDKWGIPIESTYYSGRQYAEYYLAMERVVRSRWPRLKILAGSIENHKTLDSTAGGPKSDWMEDNGIGARGFLNGFMQKVLEETGDPATLPDIITLNGYSGIAPPEFVHQNNGEYREWINRLDSLDSICRFYDYSPGYANMEYGFSPDPNSAYGVDGSSEKTHALYYLRYALLHATMQSQSGSRWNYSFYWTYESNSTTHDTGWFHDSMSPSHPGRPIRKVGKILHSAPAQQQAGLGLSSGFDIWIPAHSIRNEEIPLWENNKMECGWIDAAGQQWGAIWRYRNNSTNYYYEAIPNYEFFQAPASAPRQVHLYKFIFDEPFSFENTRWEQITTEPVQGTLSSDGNSMIYKIPAYIYYEDKYLPMVTDNPVFLKFLDE
jgi:formylglycine-generating enzyme required for sulfatase activity